MVHFLVILCKYLQNGWYAQVQDYMCVCPCTHMFICIFHSFHHILNRATTQKRLRTSVLEGHKLTCFASIREFRCAFYFANVDIYKYKYSLLSTVQILNTP